MLEELQGQEVLPRHQERILQAAGSHPVSSSDQQAAAGARDDRQTAGSLQRILRQAVPAEREVGGRLPAEAGPGLDRQEEREEAEGNHHPDPCLLGIISSCLDWETGQGGTEERREGTGEKVRQEKSQGDVGNKTEGDSSATGIWRRWKAEK